MERRSIGAPRCFAFGLLLIAWNAVCYSAEPHYGSIAPYSWQAGGYYSFVTEATVNYEGVERELNGSVLYKLHSVQEGESANLVVEDSEGAGTAFVVASDGYLLTCHRVVEDATEIAVHLGGRVFPAKVLGSEPDRDLAVLKIEASNLPSLSLAYEGDCELGMDLRAVGYPLSDILGGSLKVTEGVLTGIARHDGKRFYQTDAAINAGSRGGPVVNTKGEVVGLAGISLSGRGISEIDLAVPASQAEGILIQHSVPFSVGGGAKELDGPELARRVGPAVALVKTKTEKRLVVGSKRFALKIFNRHLMSKVTKGWNWRLFNQVFPELKNQSTEAFVLFDEFGNLLNQRGDISMPISLGIIGPLDVDAIPSPCSTTWSTRAVRPMSIGSADEDEASGVGLIPCEERCTYRVTGVTDAAVTLEKRYTLATPSGRDGPLLKIAGEGTVTLDRAQGGLKTSELTATITVNADGKQEEIPLTIRTKTRFAPREGDRAAAATPEERRAQENAASDKLDSLLAKLRDRTGRPFIYMSPLQNLEQMEPVESRRDEVLQVVRMHLDSTEPLILSLAIGAIGNWGDERNVEVVADYLEHEESSVRRNAMVALGSIGGSKAAGVVAPLLAGDGYTDAARALKEMGVDAEKAVLGQLRSRDREVRYRACQILGEIGGAASYQNLNRLLRTDRSSLVQNAARTAMFQIQSRHRQR